MTTTTDNTTTALDAEPRPGPRCVVCDPLIGHLRRMERVADERAERWKRAYDEQVERHIQATRRASEERAAERERARRDARSDFRWGVATGALWSPLILLFLAGVITLLTGTGS
jgi:hypothetical protein